MNPMNAGCGTTRLRGPLLGLGLLANALTLWPAPGTAEQGALDIQVEVFRAARMEAEPVRFGGIVIDETPGYLDLDPSGVMEFGGGVLSVDGSPRAGALFADLGGWPRGGEVLLSGSVIDLGDGVTFQPRLSGARLQGTGEQVVRIGGRIDFPGGTRDGERRALLELVVQYD